MKVEMVLTENQCAAILIALNTEQERQMADGSPQTRKLVTELRDRFAEKILAFEQSHD